MFYSFGTQMGLINWLFKKKPYSFSDAERKEALSVRYLKKEVEQLGLLCDAKDKRIKDLQDEVEGYKSTAREDKIIDLVANFFGIQTNFSNAPIKVNSPSSVSLPNITDEQINEMLTRFPKAMVKSFIKSGDSSIRDYINSKVPNLDEETFQRGLRLAKIYAEVK